MQIKTLLFLQQNYLVVHFTTRCNPIGLLTCYLLRCRKTPKRGRSQTVSNRIRNATFQRMLMLVDFNAFLELSGKHFLCVFSSAGVKLLST